METLVSYMQKLWNMDMEFDEEFGITYYNYEGKPFFLYQPLKDYDKTIERGLESLYKEDGFVWRNLELVDDVLTELGIPYDQVNKMIKKLFKERYNLTVKTGIDFGGSYFKN